MSSRPIIGIVGNRDPKLVDPPFPGILLDYTSEVYISAVEKAGGVPIEIPILSNANLVEQQLKICQGIIIQGGLSDINPPTYNQKKSPLCHDTVPQYDLKLIEIYHLARHLGIPILGLCRGHQLINVAEGGNLYQDASEVKVPEGFDRENHLVTAHPENPCHDLMIEPKTKLFALFGKSQIQVNSCHHQMIHDLGKHLRVSARTFDGVIEAIENTDGSWVMGIQWHPEILLTKNDDNLCIFKALIDEAKKIHH